MEAGRIKRMETSNVIFPSSPSVLNVFCFVFRALSERSFWSSGCSSGIFSGFALLCWWTLTFERTEGDLGTNRCQYFSPCVPRLWESTRSPKPEAQYQDYRDRAHFFTDKIKHGNFSLHLDDVRAEDKGFYRCKVYTEQESDETLVQIKVVGEWKSFEFWATFSNVFHFIVWFEILCILPEHLIVSGSNHPISAYVGEDVTMNCSVDSHITPEEIDEVSWRKTYKNEIIQVLVFEKNKIVSSDERYRDRVEFFTTEIPKGNFSLRLRSVRTEDKGVYMCHVNAGNFSANTTAVLEQLGEQKRKEKKMHAQSYLNQAFA